MKIAIIGSGISSLSSAYLLSKQHEVHVFESAERIGGHTATIDINHQGKDYAIDTGFIVYNDRTYPNFIKLMEQLGVKSQDTSMGFSVSCEKTGLEYSGAGLNTLFAQRRQLLSLKHWRMLKDILNFNKRVQQDLANKQLSPTQTLGDYLKQHNYSQRFIEHYIVPMCSAIWSATLDDVHDFPILFFARFFKNHGLLSITDRPQWKVLIGGSRQYLEPITEEFKDNIRTNTEIQSVTRHADKVEIEFSDNSKQQFDQVVFGCHSDQALALLSDASPLEEELLRALPYRDNEVVLHTDTSLLPKLQSTWSSWNYNLSQAGNEPARLSYNMNILQGIDSDSTFVVTLNATELIDPNKILGKFNYAHPVFTQQGIEAQQRWQEINGVNKTWFCGAYWGYGFHEDGCTSGIRVAQGLGCQW